MPSLPTVPVSRPVHASSTAIPFAPIADPGFDVRWDAWVARGAAHDAATRRRLILMLQVGLAITAVAGAVLLGR
jgi:hypothetical protein